MDCLSLRSLYPLTVGYKSSILPRKFKDKTKVYNQQNVDGSCFYGNVSPFGTQNWTSQVLHCVTLPTSWGLSLSVPSTVALPSGLL